MAVYNVVLNSDKFRHQLHYGPPFVNSYGLTLASDVKRQIVVFHKMGEDETF